MNNNSSSTKGAVAIIIGLFVIVGLIGMGSEEEVCLHPGCDNTRIEGTDACYKHGTNASSNSYKNSGSSYSNSSSTGSSYSNSSSTGSSSSNTTSSGSTTSTGKLNDFDTYGPEDYDDPDDYASDFAEDYAYDEFGYVDDYTYDYGYEEAYDEWCDEME